MHEWKQWVSVGVMIACGLLGALVVNKKVHGADALQLTLEGLYAPDQKIDYDGADPPAVRFLPGPRLAIHDDVWTELALPSRERDPWELPQQMRRALEMLDGVEDKAVEKALKTLGDLDPELRFSLLSIDDGLVYYDVAEQTARWITRDASNWKTPTLDPTGNRLAYVRAGDLYVHELGSGNTRRLTYDGSDTILNGRLDWVYQEEIYGRGNYKAFWWSPDGKQLAFLRLDQSDVPTFMVLDSRKPKQEVEETRYPLPGDPLSTISLRVVDLDSEQTQTIEELTDTSGALRDVPALIVQVGWRDDGTLWYALQNRQQTWLELYQVVPGTEGRKRLLREEAAWVEVLGPPHWLEDGFLWLSDRADGRRHVYRVDAASGDWEALTAGEWNVWSVEHVDTEQQFAIVIASFEPGNRVVVQVPFEGTLRKSDRDAIIGSDRGWHGVDVAPDGRWLVTRQSTIDQPTELTLWQIDEGLAERAELLHAAEMQKLKQLDLPEPRTRTFTHQGVTLPAIAFHPPGFDDSDQKWPLIIHTYAGPQAPVATNRWRGTTTLWHHWLAQQGFVVLLIDVRSSGGRGIADTYAIKGRMGFDELADLNAVLDQLSEEPWFDAERIGLWGWSYGGYFTAFAMLHSDRFRCGIAGAPVTDWRNYDAIYTERYMDLPDANREGYADTTLADRAAELHGRLLLIHGERDDNVHPSNTLQLADALQRAGKPFDLMLYPGERHSIHDAARREHLHQLMAEFWQRYLK